MDILQDFPIKASPEQIFDAVSTPVGLNAWWTLTSAGEPIVGTSFELGFGSDYQWRAVVTQSARPSVFELQLTTADADWTGSRVGFEITPTPSGSRMRFWHTGWPKINDHYRTSSHCWALYLRLLRRYLEFGECVEYTVRLDV